MAIIAKGRDFELCPPGLHHAVIKEIKQFEHESWGDRVRFTFETDKIGKEGQPLSVFSEASLSLSPKAKLSGIVENILGREITSVERKNGFDIEPMLGMKCMVNVKIRVSKAGNEYSYVENVITDNGNQQQPTPATVEADNEAGEEESANE